MSLEVGTSINLILAQINSSDAWLWDVVQLFQLVLAQVNHLHTDGYIRFKSINLVTYLQELEVRGVLFQELDRLNLVRRCVESKQVWEVSNNLDLTNVILRHIDVLQVLVCLQIR